MKKIIVIVGPTGVGKTKVSIELAKTFSGEIINCDSMQVYKHLNIGTAKITDHEKEDIVHHLLDIKQLDEDYTVYDFQSDARKKINDILNNKNLPIMVGGTGLYIKATLYNYEFNKEQKNFVDYKDIPNETLYDMLYKLDPTTDIHKNNRVRLIRALNYYTENKEPISVKPKSDTLLYNAIIIGLTMDRKALYDRINDRVDQMIKEGLIEEVKALYDKGVNSKPITTGISYKELYRYFDNEITLNEAIDLIKQNSRNYAKRQYTFFQNQLNVTWFNVNDDFNKTIKEIKETIKKELI